MRLIKTFIVGLIGLFIAITLFSLLLPSKVEVLRAVILNATTNQVYKQVSDLKRWKNWQPVFANNSSVITYSDSSDNKNAYCDLNYNGREVHVGIISIDSPSVTFLLQAKGEDDIFNKIDIVPILAQNKVQVEWKAVTKLHWYPWEKFYGIFIDRITGPGYEESLNSLKKFVEAQR